MNPCSTFWKQVFIAGASLGIPLAVLLTQTRCTINQTPSLSYSAFICTQGLTTRVWKPQRGDFVSIQGHPTAFFKGRHYTKRLVGLPGDRIHRQGRQLIVTPVSASVPVQSTCGRSAPDHKACADTLLVSRKGTPRIHRNTHGAPLFSGPLFSGTLHPSTRDGKTLHPLQEKSIPEGYVFVSADHPRSFDSRYEEFGLVKQEQLSGRCWGLFQSTLPVQERSR